MPVARFSWFAVKYLRLFLALQKSKMCAEAVAPILPSMFLGLIVIDDFKLLFLSVFWLLLGTCRYYWHQLSLRNDLIMEPKPPVKGLGVTK